MMTNKEIAKHLDFIAILMELHDENPFKIRSYQNSYNVLRQSSLIFSELNLDELVAIKGIGKSIASDIVELNQTGKINTLSALLEKTPEGIIDLLKIKGIGTKKIRTIWYELSVTSLGELEYAIKENRLTLLKGFGTKIQESILNQIEFLNSNSGKLLYFKASYIADDLIKKLKEKFPDHTFEITGELRRKMPVIEKIEIISDIADSKLLSFVHPDFLYENESIKFKNAAVRFWLSDKSEFEKKLFLSTGPSNFIENFKIGISKTEGEIFAENNSGEIPPHFRDLFTSLDKIHAYNIEKYIAQSDIKGVLHNHTVWSDGSDKLFDMASYYKELGYEYMLVSEHSKSAFYANGVKENDVIRYIDEVKETNAKIENFTVFAGIESDILSDGNLDYSNDILSLFDVIISSVHSGLQMDKNKATERLIKAIENPYTRILGHMTGRILLAREGYPLDFDKIFDACAYNNVAIELNCNPLRMDIDWTLISKAQEKGIKFCINPDAHSKFEVKYIDYGVTIAQKGGMEKADCINAKNTDEFIKWINDGKR